MPYLKKESTIYITLNCQIKNKKKMVTKISIMVKFYSPKYMLTTNKYHSGGNIIIKGDCIFHKQVEWKIKLVIESSFLFSHVLIVSLK